MLYIYTETFKPWPRLKRIVKRLIRPNLGGPKAVENSLVLGLKSMGQAFVWNQASGESGGVACVLSGVETLRWAIKQKRVGRFARLVAGPNIVVTPLDFGQLILSPEIDAYVVPAQWSADWWLSLAPELKSKLRVWPAGVEDLGRLADPKGKILVFQKNGPVELYNFIIQELRALGLDFLVIKYGNFSKAEYFKYLSQSRLVVYLSQSESQGLALHEAWMAGLPTLVYNTGVLKWRDYVWRDEKISAPYLCTECGIFFNNQQSFRVSLDNIQANWKQFHPREHSLKYFSNQVSAQNYLSIINSL